MKKTLLLCFIHGFKGGDDTFGGFPEHLRAIVQNGLPKIRILAIQYPKFETQGDLTVCVSKFRDWLQEKIIDLEVENASPSPTIDPSVRTILIGHSMGGIVAADTTLLITSDKMIEGTKPDENIEPSNFNSLMFPYIQGVLAFDTPYLGISPGVVAHGAEGHYNTASAAFTQISGLASTFWGAKAATDASRDRKEPVAALPAPPAKEEPASGWARWGKIAAAAGGVAAVAGAGTAAFVNREKITEGWSWVGSHLEFVGCLMQGENLRKRVSGMVELRENLGVGWANLYTRLGKQAVSKNDGSMVGSVIGNQRTFCNLPKKNAKAFWEEAINDAAHDETGAHMAMFYPKDNPGYYEMADAAKKLIVDWTKNEWYEFSDGNETKTFDIENEEL